MRWMAWRATSVRPNHDALHRLRRRASQPELQLRLLRLLRVHGLQTAGSLRTSTRTEIGRARHDLLPGTFRVNDHTYRQHLDPVCRNTTSVQCLFSIPPASASLASSGSTASTSTSASTPLMSVSKLMYDASPSSVVSAGRLIRSMTSETSSLRLRRSPFAVAAAPSTPAADARDAVDPRLTRLRRSRAATLARVWSASQEGH